MKSSTRLKGKLSLHPKGFGFVKPECGHEDVFIPPTKLNSAIDGDLVIVTSLRKGQKGWEGVIESIAKRGRNRMVGAVVDFNEKGDAMIFAPTAGEERLFVLKKSPKQKFSIGDRVSINVDNRSKNLSTCTLHKYFGSIDDALIDTDVAIEEYELTSTFPPAALKEASKFSPECKLTKDRVDLRDLECVTIDPKTARDYDDALSITKDKNGCYHLGIHIADVSHYVKDGSELDKSAYARGNSTYFVDKVVPMLPEQLSNELCSIKEGVDRYSASVLMEFNTKGELKNYKIVRGLIRSRKRFSYEEAKQVLDRKIKSPHLDLLKLLVELCMHLKKQKKERGCVELSMPEIRLVLDDQGIPYTEEWIPYDITHQLVEEFMLKANELVAIELMKRGKQSLFRVHEVPDEKDLEEFFTLVGLLGYKIPRDSSTENIRALFEEAENSPFVDQLSQRYIRTMKLAIYSAENIGHYGLNLEHYTHFTSPIRRYTDLVVHRLIFDKDYDPDVEVIAAHCSDTERKSFRAEMSCLRLKKLRYIDRLTEEDPEITFDATITNIKPQWVYFNLDFISYEGSIHVSELGDEYFQYNDKDRTFTGTDTQLTYHLGRKIVVQLETIDLVFGECTWNLIP